MTRPLEIEFAGAPGSGKTSLSRATADFLRSEGIQAFTVIEAARIRAAETIPGSLLSRVSRHQISRLLLWWLFYLNGAIRAIPFLWNSHREWMDLAFALFRRRIRPRLKVHIAWWLMQLGGRRAYLGTSRWIDAVLYDDGFVHRSVALFSAPGEPGEPGSVEAYIETVPRPAVVVHVRADAETCLQRVLERGVWNHSKTATREELETYVEGAGEIVSAAVQAVRQQGIKVIEVDNSDGKFDGAVETLSTDLESILRSQTCRGQRA